MQVLHELTAEGVLKSTSFTEDGEKVIMESFRELKEGDKWLDVLMVKPTAEGPQRVYQRYERVQ